MKRNYLKGDVILVELGKPPKGIKGHEQAYKRPCVVLKAFPQLQLAIIIPFTSASPKYSYYSIVRVLKGANGLTEDSFALCHQIRAVSFDRIISKTGTLDVKDILKIQAVLIDLLDI
ncbi:MAG: type II toxin-antitoxin system PemK/MazF family toxin [Bacteroidetes bacterium]|nr:type II toxin-antitoxin system PemK/MazF family toxin [Bacteroidota bacterium]